MGAQLGDKVSVHFTGLLENGEMFDTSEGKKPIVFELGSEEVISGFNSGLVGMTEGEKRRIELPPEEAYGVYIEELIQQFPMKSFDGGVEQGLTVHGMVSGQVATGTILDVGDETVMVDFNHPLAGETLIFDVKLLKIG
jgi:peptidylprolyl isomerase|tara:strand:- start:91 stop:507 length:417 start_codon:yes stop_codon:yes gene_type:complete